MKKAAAFILTICMVIMAVAPVSIKAAADNMFYITYQANIGNQDLIDMGYVQPNSNGSVSLFMTDNQIDAYNALTLPVDLSDWDYYILTGANTWQGENFSSVSNGVLVVYNSENPIIMYNGRPQLRDLYSATSSYQNGTYTWVTANQISFYDSDLKQKQLDGDFKIYDIQNGSFTERSNYAFYQDVSIGVTGTYICSTNQPVYYYGGDICANSTATVTNYYNQNEVVAWFIDGVEKSENVLPKFKVTDGETILDYDNSIGGGVPDLQHDGSLAFSTIDLAPVKNNDISPLIDGLLTWTIDTGSFDFTFGNDNVKKAAAAGKWGLEGDIEVKFTIQGGNSGTFFQPIAGQNGSCVVYSHVKFDNLFEPDFLSGQYRLNLDEIIQNGYAYSGSDVAAYLITVFTVYKDAPSVIKYVNNHVASSGSAAKALLPTLQNLAGQNEHLKFLSAVDFDALATYFNGNNDFDFELNSLYFDGSFVPFNSGIGISGQSGKVYADLYTGVHGGSAAGAVVPSPDPDGSPIIQPDFISPDQQNYYTPVVLPSGGNGYALQQGDPSATAYGGAGGAGGNAMVNVNANPIINIQNGFDEFAKVMKLSENSNHIQKTFWGSFGYFRDNPATDLYKDYFGWLPEEFVTFILTCCTVTFGIGVFRFIRGRSL